LIRRRCHRCRQRSPRQQRQGRRRPGQPCPADGPGRVHPGQRQPGTQRDKDGSNNEIEDDRTRQEVDPDDRASDDTWQRSSQQQPGQRSAGLSLPPVAPDRARAGHHVIEQVRRRHRRARRAKHADLKRQQQNRPGYPRRGGDHRDSERGHQSHDLDHATADHPANVPMVGQPTGPGHRRAASHELHGY